MRMWLGWVSRLSGVFAFSINKSLEGVAILLLALSLTAPVAAQDNRTVYEYDGLGRLVKETRPDENGETVFTYDVLGNRLTAVESTTATSNIALVLVDPTTDLDIRTLSLSDSIDPAELSDGVNYSLRADYLGSEAVGSVRFYENSVLARNENVAPYARFGDGGGGTDYLPGPLPSSAFTVNVRVFSQSNGGGTVYADETYSIAIGSGSPPAVFSINDVSVSEGGALTFTVSKTGGASSTNDVSYATANGSAGSGDYTPNSGTLTFAPSDTSKPITVQTTQDSIYENAETVIVNLSNATNGASISDSQGIGTINNNDTAPSFSVDNVTVTEGATVTFTVTKTGATAFSHNISYATANSTASAGTDYTSISGTLTFAAGETSKTVSVLTADDAINENAESFFLNLSNATNGATINDAQGVATLNDNDDAPSFAVNDVTVTEGGALVFTVTKTGSSAVTHNVSNATADNTALAGSDYTAESGTLSFGPSETSKTVSVSSTNDNTHEDAQSFYINLSSATNGATISDSQGVGTINDNDPAPSFSVNNASVFENAGPMIFTVTKTGASEKTHAVSYATAPNTASTGDYTSQSGTLSFTSAQTTRTVSVPITDDIVQEATETFHLNLSSPTNGATISDSQGVGTIEDDDCPVSCV